MGGKINCNCNGGHVGQDCFVSFGAYHFLIAKVAEPLAKFCYMNKNT